MKKLIILLIIAAVLTGCSSKAENSSKTTTENTQEKPYEEELKNNIKKIMAPDFELKNLDGTIVKLSDLRGKNVIINFWATWCGYCVEEMPDLQKLQDTYKDDLIVLTVNVGESKEVVEKFMKDNNLELQVVLDEKSNVANMYGVRSFPTSLAVSNDGEAIASHIGMLTYEQMEQLYDFFEKE